MKTKDIIKKLKEILENEDFILLDELLHEVYSSPFNEWQEKLSDILDEATLYLEFKEEDYKNTALEMIENL